MDPSQPKELTELHEKLEEIFWFVKNQAGLASGNSILQSNCINLDSAVEDGA